MRADLGSVVDSGGRNPETPRMRTRTPARAAAGHDVNAYLARRVPITQAMGIRLRSFDDAGVTMTAPLKPNINDKGIAFGGSLASILALAGWALTDLLLREAGETADVLIAAAATEFLAPVPGRIVARCPLPPAEEVSAFLAAYRLRGKARLRLEAFIETKTGKAALFHATYVARRVTVDTCCPSRSGADSCVPARQARSVRGGVLVHAAQAARAPTQQGRKKPS